MHGSATSARAALLTSGGSTIGTLSTQGPSASSDADSGGVNVWANWTLNAGQTQIDASSLRWLQLASFSIPVPGFPNRPFIDPQSGQILGGTVTADNLPWYDITGDSKTGLSLTGGGLGSWFGDGPFAQWSLGPLTFTADTLVVAVTDLAAKQARILGGVEWAYSIGSIAGVNQVSVTGPIDLANSQPMRDAFNTQLAVDFPGWSLIVPEPATCVLLLSAGLVLVRRLRWHAYWSLRR